MMLDVGILIIQSSFFLWIQVSCLSCEYVILKPLLLKLWSDGNILGIITPDLHTD